MAKQGTPLSGLALIAQRVFSGPAYSLIAYTNTQDSLGPATALSDLMQPTQTNGYAPIVLDGVWDFTGGVATYTHSAGASNDGLGNPSWTASAGWSANVTGVAMIYGSVVQHFMDLRDGSGNPNVFTAAAGKKLAVVISNLVSP